MVDCSNCEKQYPSFRALYGHRKTCLKKSCVTAFSDADKGWFAGIVDGEGCLNIQHLSTGGYSGRLVITNTSLILLDACRKLIAGTGKLNEMSGDEENIRNGRTKQGHQLTIRQPDLRPVLEQIVPYLRLKQEPAQIMLAFLDTGPTSEIPYETYKNALHALNHRGQNAGINTISPVHMKSLEVIRSWLSQPNRSVLEKFKN